MGRFLSSSNLMPGMQAPVGGGGELFPDPTLADVADNTDGWLFNNGFPTFGPKAGTGPGVQAASSTGDDGCGLSGANSAAMAASAPSAGTYAVAVTFANVSAAVDLNVTLGGPDVLFTPSNGTVTQNVTSPGPASFFMYPTGDGGTYDITHISVTAP